MKAKPSNYSFKQINYIYIYTYLYCVSSRPLCFLFVFIHSLKSFTKMSVSNDRIPFLKNSLICENNKNSFVSRIEPFNLMNSPVV